jgi:hypothetical protein
MELVIPVLVAIRQEMTDVLCMNTFHFCPYAHRNSQNIQVKGKGKGKEAASVRGRGGA